MFEQHPKTEECAFGELEIGDHFLLVNYCNVGYFTKRKHDLEDADTIEKVIFESGETVEGDQLAIEHCVKTEVKSFGRTNCKQWPGYCGGTHWRLEDNHPVIKLEKFSVSKKSFIDKVKEVFDVVLEGAISSALEGF